MIEHEGITVRCELLPMWHEVIVWVVDKHDKIISVAKSLEFTSDIEPGLAPEPTFRLRLEEAQYLMDELWRVGLRPTEGSGSAGAMAATEKHLEDMRKFAFKWLDVH